MIELHGARTGNCIRVAIALEEAGLRYRIVPVDLSNNEHQGDGYLKLNPAGRVPTIVDHPENGEPFVLTQSNAILHYIAAKRPGHLWPVDDERAIARAYERLLYFITDVLAPSHAAFFIRSASGDGKDRLARRSLDALMAAERFVADSPFMAGHRFTLADIVAVTIAQASHDDQNWDALPNLRLWYAEVMSRPGVRLGFRAFD